MTVDERIDKLTEGHGALTQSIELLTADVKELTRGVREMRTSFEQLGHAVAGLVRVAFRRSSKAAAIVRRRRFRAIASNKRCEM